MAGLRWHDWLLSVGQNGCFYSSANRRDLRVPAHRARHRAEDGGAARGIGRHREVPRTTTTWLVLRHSPEGEELRHVGEVGQGVQAGRREAQVSSDLLVQQPGEVVGALRRVLPGLQGAGHGARAGAQGRREEAAQGDIRVMRDRCLPGVASKVDKTIGTPNDYLSNLAVGDVPYVLALGETPCASGRGLLAGIARLLGVLQALWQKMPNMSTVAAVVPYCSHKIMDIK